MTAGTAGVGGPTSVAAVFEGDYPTGRAVQAILERHGFAVVSFGERPPDVASTVKLLDASLVVLELAMVGAAGLGVVRHLLDAVAGCAVILLSPFDTLRGAALAAGAFELVGTDLAALDVCLGRLLAERRSAGSRPTFAPVDL